MLGLTFTTTTRLIAACAIAVGPLCAAAADVVVVPYGGRDMLVYVPASLSSQRATSASPALVVVLHGGFGNASRIVDGSAESGLNMNAVADQYGFVVAYLNGTPVTRMAGKHLLGWNAGGGCCGQSAANDIADVAYIHGAVDDLVKRYGIDRTRVFAMGHSNGAMMTQRLVCESTVFVAGVAISGPLNLDVAVCPAAAGHRLLAIHGADDLNVPVAGGAGSRGLSQVAYRSEQQSSATFTASGAAYTLQVVPGADHTLAHIDAAIVATDGLSIAQKSARFFGLAKP